VQELKRGAAQLFMLEVYENQSNQVTYPVARMSDVGRWLVRIAVLGDIRLNYLSQLPCAVQKICSATAEVKSAVTVLTKR